VAPYVHWQLEEDRQVPTAFAWDIYIRKTDTYLHDTSHTTQFEKARGLEQFGFDSHYK